MLEESWRQVVGSVAGCVVGMVVRRGEKATDFCGFWGCVGVDDIGGRVGLVKPKRRGVVLAEVAVELERGCRE